MCRIFRTLFLSALLLLTIATLPAAAENRVALVVGNAHYKFIPSLANPAGDARLMAETLKDLGFTLIGDGAQLDLDKAALDEAIRTFGTKLRGADVGLFYYAGHGLQLRGTNYLVPTGANPAREADADFELDDLSLVLRQMEASGTRLNLVMLDACRNNPFAGRGFRAIDAGLAQIRAPEGTLISFATQPGSIALDGIDGNSPYTKALAQTIRKPGLGVFDVFNNVGLMVKKATAGEQQPWVSSSPIDGSFYFAAKQEETPPVAANLAGSGKPPAAPNGSAVEAPSLSSNVPSPSQDKPVQAATLSPAQQMPSEQKPSDDKRKEERGVAIYDGRWTNNTTGSCTKPVRSQITIKNGVIMGGANGGGRVTADGHVSGSFKSGGILPGQFWGRMSSSSFGSGSWRNSIGCSGAWTFTKS
jgi:caspase domain-containing protein